MGGPRGNVAALPTNLDDEVRMSRACGASAPPPPLPTSDHLALAVRTARHYHALGLDPADLEQEATLALLEALPLFDPTRHECPLEAYLATCIKKHLSRLVVADKRRRDPIFPLSGDPVDPRSLHQPATLAHECGHVLDQLTPRQRQVLEMTAAGHSDQEISQELATTTGCVQSSRSQAVSRLRELLA